MLSLHIQDLHVGYAMLRGHPYTKGLVHSLGRQDYTGRMICSATIACRVDCVSDVSCRKGLPYRAFMLGTMAKEHLPQCRLEAQMTNLTPLSSIVKSFTESELQSMFLDKAFSPFWRAVCSVEDASLWCINSECGVANCEDKNTSGTQNRYNAAQLDLSVLKRIPPFNQRSC